MSEYSNSQILEKLAAQIDSCTGLLEYLYSIEEKEPGVEKAIEKCKKSIENFERAANKFQNSI